MPLTMSGVLHDASIEMGCGLALIVPDCQVHPKIVVDAGAMMVLEAARHKPHLCRA